MQSLEMYENFMHVILKSKIIHSLNLSEKKKLLWKEIAKYLKIKKHDIMICQKLPKNN